MERSVFTYREKRNLAYTNRPGAYWAVMSKEARFYKISNMRDEKYGDKTYLDRYKKLGESHIKLSKWAYQNNLLRKEKAQAH